MTIDSLTFIQDNLVFSPFLPTSGPHFTTAYRSALGRLLGLVNRTSTDIKILESSTNADYQPLTVPLIRSDFETALALQEVGIPGETGDTWLMEEDLLLPFRPKWSVTVKATIRYVGKLKAGEIDFEDDLLD